MSVESDATRAAQGLSWCLAVALLGQAAGGFCWPTVYRDNLWVRSVLVGTDFVSLVLILPLLVGGLLLSRGSLRVRLGFNGVLYYIFYNNFYYLLSAFNPLFLIYVAVCVLSLAALIASLLATNAQRLAESARRIARLQVCGVLLGSAMLLALMWIGQSVQYLVDGALPQLIVDTGGPTNVVAVLDLTLVVPLLFVSATWLWKSKAWGVTLAAGILVQCTLVTLCLLVTPWFQASSGIAGAWAMAPLWGVMGAVFLAAALEVLRRVPSGKNHRLPGQAAYWSDFRNFLGAPRRSLGQQARSARE